MTAARRSHFILGGALVAVLAATVIVGNLPGGPSAVVPHHQNVGSILLLWLHAPRDAGRLLPRSTWCTGTEHCWLAQEAPGAIQMTDTVGAWTLATSGTPRTGVYTGLPTEDVSGWVDFSSELSTHTDGQSASDTGSWFLAAQTQAATNLVSITAVILAVKRQPTARVLYSHRLAGGTGIEVGLANDGKFYATVQNGTGTAKTITTSSDWDDETWHEVVFRLDGRTTNAGKIYIGNREAQAANPDLNTGGSWATTASVVLGADALGANIWPGGIARLAVSLSAASPVGTLWELDPQSDALVSTADVLYYQSGVARCYSSGVNTALCIPGGKLPIVYSPGLLAAGRNPMDWTTGTSRTSRLLNTEICAAGGWNVTGVATATCYSVVASTGVKSASRVASMGTCCTSVVSKSASGYPNAVTLYPSAWVRCSAGGVMRWQMSGGGAATGRWDINCATISGQWTLIRHGHPAVTETTLWLSSTSGGIVFNLAASAAGFPGADIWGLTVTAEDGIEVIPTRTSPAITGKVDWFVDNVPAAYYSGSCGKVFMAGEWNSGGCLDVVTDTSGVGRQDNDGTHWHLSNSAAIEIATANLVPAGVDLLQFRWNSSVALDGGAIFAEVLRNGVTQTWDVAPVAPWVPASPTAIRLSGYGSTSCWAGVQEVKIWSRP
jgi:hypothetical protein